MRAAEIESWTLDVVDHVKAHLRVEDSRVECKAAWIDPVQAARRIAGHANAARGEGILWVMGLDEKRGLVVGVTLTEFSAWWAKVESQFDEGMAPAVQDVAVHVDKRKAVDALYMETDRAPFVIRNPGHGTVKGMPKFEVPWREGTAVRSASRAEILRLLVPRMRQPEIEVLQAEGTYWPGKRPNELNLRMRLVLYVMPRPGAPLVIPFHRCIVSLMRAGLPEPAVLSKLSAETHGDPRVLRSGGSPADPRSVYATGGEVVFNGSGAVGFIAMGRGPDDFARRIPIAARLHMRPVHAEEPVVVEVGLMPEAERDDGVVIWKR